ncbi:MAG: ATP-binding protein [Alphaproteobacteria bacterium]
MATRTRPPRSLAVLAAIALSALGIAASLYSFHALVTRFYVTRENLVWVSTRAEVELARYASSLLGMAAAGSPSPASMAEAELRFDIFLSRLELFRGGHVHDALAEAQEGRALLARIETLEPALDPRAIADWSPDSVRALERRLAAAAVLLQEISIIALRREVRAEQELLRVLDTSVAASGGFLALGALAPVFFLRARNSNLRNAERARAAAEAADRAKGDFLAKMSHEIRTPLNAVIGFSNLLGGTALTTQQRQFVETMEAAGGQLLQVVNDVLDFSRLQAGRVELAAAPIELRGFVDRLLLVIGGLPGASRLAISSSIAPGLPSRVLGDDARLMQVLSNLLANAVKFTREGEVRLEVSAARGPGGGEVLRFAVSDTGPGVPEDMREGIFEPFRQAGAERLRPREGTGLGLSISRGFARLMGGDLELMPATGRGACFVTTLPLRPAAEGGDAQAAAPAAPRSGPLCILVAEDTPTNQLVIRLMLEGLGHRVRLAANGVEAVEAFAQEPFDLVVLDIQMPLMDGFEAARRIRDSGARGRSVPILALTAFTQPSDRDEAARCGIDGFLSKPVRQKDLVEALAGFAGKASRAA